MSYLNIQQVEYALRELLRKARERDQENYRLTTLSVYDELRFRFSSLTAGVFNKLVGDLKRLGVVGTTKDSELFLSDDAWKNDAVHSERIRQAVERATFRPKAEGEGNGVQS